MFSGPQKAYRVGVLAVTRQKRALTVIPDGRFVGNAPIGRKYGQASKNYNGA